MKPHLTPLRKAAILLSTLDDECAQALFARMDTQQAARVRREIDQLGEVEAELRREIVAEFRQQDRAPGGGQSLPALRSVRDRYPLGIELDTALAEKLSQPELPATYSPPGPSAQEPAPFRFLHEAEADTLVEYLRCERPQTIAVVVSHLAPSQAADVLDRLAPAVQAQVLRRLAELDETDAAVLGDIERHFEARISEHLRSRQRRQAGLHALDAIISAAGSKSRRDMVANLLRHDSALAEKLGFESSPSSTPYGAASINNFAGLQFAEVVKFDRARLRALLESAEMEVVVLALAGASGDFVERAAACLPAKRAKLLRHALAHLGPTRLGDVEEAQQALADLAAHLDTRKARRESIASAAA